MTDSVKKRKRELNAKKKKAEADKRRRIRQQGTTRALQTSASASTKILPPSDISASMARLQRQLDIELGIPIVSTPPVVSPYPVGPSELETSRGGGTTPMGQFTQCATSRAQFVASAAPMSSVVSTKPPTNVAVPAASPVTHAALRTSYALSSMYELAAASIPVVVSQAFTSVYGVAAASVPTVVSHAFTSAYDIAATSLAPLTTHAHIRLENVCARTPFAPLPSAISDSMDRLQHQLDIELGIATDQTRRIAAGPQDTPVSGSLSQRVISSAHPTSEHISDERNIVSIQRPRAILPPIEPSPQERARVVRPARVMSTPPRASALREDFNEQWHLQHELPKRDKQCTYCHALLWADEKKTMPCCHKGQHISPPMTWPDGEDFVAMTRLFYTRSFIKNIKKYNSLFAFTSIGVKIDELPAGGPQTYRILGELHHKIGSLLPPPGKPPGFAQVYFLDAEGQLDHRLQRLNFFDLNSPEPARIVRFLQGVMERHNGYAALYEHARVRLQEAETVSIVLKAGVNGRTENVPAIDEVAIILPDEDTICQPRDIILRSRVTGGLTRIDESFPSYDPLQYPLLFPTGRNGWSRQYYTSLQKYFKFYLYQRKGFSILHYSGKLAQQYLVDAFCRVEADRLRWIRNNQLQLRAEELGAIADDLAGENLGRVGRRVYLPPSFTGGKRYMTSRYQDAIAIVRKFGKPDLFITVTCNTNWPEIQELLNREIFEGRAFKDDVRSRDDIICRVFRMKLKAIENDLKTAFGPSIASVRVVEFQKRGLPHAHILLILQNKIIGTEEIDKFVWAEVPDKEKHPRLYEIVTRHMIHRCSPHTCLKDGLCGAHFPMQYSEETSADRNGYPVYRRRRRTNPDGISNQFVVPYNPYLLLKYNCHINVEVCTSISSVKYLYKYVFKGHDRVNMEVTVGNRFDEISTYLSKRYVSVCEAVYRIFEFKISKRSHSVDVLPVHLPDAQLVTFRDEANAAEVIERAQHTKLTRYFDICREHYDICKDLVYVQIPEYFAWIKTTKKWKPRVANTKTVGRVPVVSLRDSERFHLRMLLMNRTCPTSFEDLRTVNGDVYCSFKAAALALGYLDTDVEWDNCLYEAAAYKMPSQMRLLFCTLLTECSPGDIQLLWNKHRISLSEDFLYRYPDNPDRVIAETIYSLNYYLESMGSSLSRFQSLPQLADYLQYRDVAEAPRNIRVVEEETNYPVEDLDDILEKKATMTDEHRAFYNDVLRCVQGDVPKMYFLQGEGGSGKTYISQIILAEVRKMGKIALAVASSGLASLLLTGGRTAHNRFKLPLNPERESTCVYSTASPLATLLRQTSLIVWDEVSMTHKFLIEAVDRMFRDILDTDVPFGGKVIVFSGDFKQILPVIQRAPPSEVVDATLIKSRLWDNIQQVKLTSNRRLNADGLSPQELSDMQDFATFLRQLGEGRHEPIEGMDRRMIRLPDNIGMHYDDASSLTEFINHIYGDMNTVDEAGMDKFLSERAILTPKNYVMNMLNSEVLQRLPGETVVYTSSDSVADQQDEDMNEQNMLCFPTELLNTMEISGFPPHKLELKIGCPVMLLRNICPAKGLCNGTRLIVTHLGARVIKGRILTGTHAGEEVFIPRIIFLDTESASRPFQLKRRQFPIRVAFAMTINKAQGQTIEHLGVFLPEPVFAHGQLYVAFSRVTSPHNIKVLVQNGRFDGDDGVYTRNVVYYDVFDSEV